MSSTASQLTEFPLSRGGISALVRRSSVAQDSAVILLPGLLGNHKIWSSVLPRLPQNFDTIAIDFAGRHGSYACDAEWGIDRHVVDVVEISRLLGYKKLLVVGYSFGGFVGCRLAERFEDLVSSLVVIDGGVTFAGELAVSPTMALQSFLGPSWDRIVSVYPNHEACLSAWRSHPSLADVAPLALEEYVSYGVAGAAPNVRYRANLEGIIADGFELLGDGLSVTALARIPHPVELLRSENRQIDRPTLLIEDGTVAAFVDVKSSLNCVTVPGTNHVSLPLTVAGADAIAASVRRVSGC